MTSVKPIFTRGKLASTSGHITYATKNKLQNTTSQNTDNMSFKSTNAKRAAALISGNVSTIEKEFAEEDMDLCSTSTMFYYSVPYTIDKDR